MTMYIELLGGPDDGSVLVVPDDTKIWVTARPAMTPAQLASLDVTLPGMADQPLPREEHAYIVTENRNLRNGAILFQHAGVRQKS